MSIRNSLSVAVGGGTGVLLRYSLILLFDGSGIVPAAIIIANMCGCFILGYVTAHPILKNNAIHWLGTGFAGGLTTFSTWILQIIVQFGNRDYAGAFYNLTGSLIAGTIAAVFGYYLIQAVI